MEARPSKCPYCRADILVMASLNNRKVAVDLGTVDELLCRLAGGRLVFDRDAGHVLHNTTCTQGWRFRSDATASEIADEAERRAEFRRRHTRKRAEQEQFKRVDSPLVAAYRELQLDVGAAPVAAKAAFRKLSLQFHPDVNPSGLERMKRITSAYDVLKRSGLT
jgi:hypothetical protein